MAEEKNKKIVLEREYVIPLRREFAKVPIYRKANKAVKALKEFIVRHMKVYDRDLRKVKLDIYLNNEIRFKGMRKPLPKVKVKAIKYDDGTVVVKLVQLPKHIEFELARKVKKEAESLKKAAEAEKAVAEAEKKEESKDVKEKEISSKEAMQAEEKALAKEAKHTSGTKKEPEIQRKQLKK